MSDQLHPLAPHHLPGFITAPGETDVWMVVMGIFLIVAVLAVGNFYLQLHSLPERMAHRSQKLQFEVVAVLGLLALFTHVHLFWIAALLLAMIDVPDFGTPMRSIANSVEGSPVVRQAMLSPRRGRPCPSPRGDGRAETARAEEGGAPPCLS